MQRPNAQTSTAYAGPQRLKSRDEGSIRWVELLDKFKTVQEKSRRSQRSQRLLDQDGGSMQNPSLTAALSAAATADQSRTREKSFPEVPRTGGGLGISNSGTRANSVDPKGGSILSGSGGGRSKSSLSNLGRLGIGSRKSKR